MRIGLFGGTFNPVHFGHVGLARRAVDALRLDRLIVLPARVSPFKTETPPDEEDRLWNRLGRVTAAFADVPRAEVDLREITRGGVSYAIDTVREIAAENPGSELFFLIGEDTAEGLSRWREIETLRSLVTFKSFPRTRESSTEIRQLFASAHVVRNPDARLAAVVEEGVLRKGGFCPCRLAKAPEFFCPCEEFKAQMRNPEYHGPCHCRLYVKP